jgi:AbrB family looped-hinge helix DNA binding protein
MTNETKLSVKGQIVIPKDVRDKYGWKPGALFEVFDGPAGVMLRAKKPEKAKLAFEDATAALRKLVRYQGPVYSDAEGNAAIDRMFREGAGWDSEN